MLLIRHPLALLESVCLPGLIVGSSTKCHSQVACLQLLENSMAVHDIYRESITSYDIGTGFRFQKLQPDECFSGSEVLPFESPKPPSIWTNRSFLLEQSGQSR